MKRRYALTAAVLCTVGLSSALAQPSNGPAPVTGVAPDGTPWTVQVPARWNGSLLIYSRGGAIAPGLPIQLAPRDSAPTLLAHGYALAGTGYQTHGWNPLAGALGQFAALPQIEAAIGKAPTHVINVGTSYGGLVGATEVDRTQGEITGSVLTCGLIVGGIDLMNAQLDGAYAINQLLTTDHDIPLVHLIDAEGVSRSAKALQATITQARATPTGRARLALAAALMHVPTWRDGNKPNDADLDAQAAQQVEWFIQGMGRAGDAPGLFGFMLGSRLDIETNAGGNASWNRGVDYAALLRDNEFRPIVEALYHKAGLDLNADLATLTASATLAPDPAAVAWMKQTSVLSGRAPVPVLAMQTSGDPVAPHAVLTAYRARAEAAGTGAMVRTAMVDHPGHCAFQPSEILAAVDALRHRLDSGQWGDATSSAHLQAAAGPAAAFVPTPDGPFVAHAPPR